MDKPPYPGTRLHSMRIPNELWRDAIAVSKDRGESVTAVVVRALENYVRRHRKEQQP